MGCDVHVTVGRSWKFSIVLFSTDVKMDATGVDEGMREKVCGEVNDFVCIGLDC